MNLPQEREEVIREEGQEPEEVEREVDSKEREPKGGGTVEATGSQYLSEKNMGQRDALTV